MLPTKQETQEIIPPELAKLLLEVINQGYTDYYKNITDSSRARCTLTTKANFINDHMIFHAKDKLSKYPSEVVKFIPKYGRIRLMICERFEVKLKKLNRNRRSSNILTNAVRLFNENNPNNNQTSTTAPYQTELPGVLYPITNLHAGYQANRTNTGVEAVFIVCPEGNKNKWEWKIDFDEQPLKKPPVVQTPNRPSPNIVKPKFDSVKRDIRIEEKRY